jgi:hypothetical protein
MEFRWVAVLALWTLLSGPIFDRPGSSSSKPDRTRTAPGVYRAGVLPRT